MTQVARRRYDNRAGRDHDGTPHSTTACRDVAIVIRQLIRDAMSRRDVAIV
jgi:hypothetical protein